MMCFKKVLLTIRVFRTLSHEIPFHLGPDICGYSTKKVHVIFNYKGKNHLIKKEIKCKVHLALGFCVVNMRTGYCNSSFIQNVFVVFVFPRMMS